ncbi:hypothetical protein BOH66_01180 [Microbacterium aurum]|uniref:Uncharacterized protein n=1 Tax=Microbacterium aurum TaxID=36805 RepID=A0A1P8U4P6_9MICO|nr:hypothetical protein [Microbacterium aurum]APZ33063.1 hypothetical protein BOH66_01180 [Microbacterium aurum]MBM7826620.1 hypothetical protein [Microbacterium aurum]
MRLRAIIAVLLATTISLAAPPAYAEEIVDPTDACTIGGVAVPEGEAPPADIPVVISCFDSQAEAEAFIEAGAPGDIEQLIGTSQARSASAAAASTVTIGSVWTGLGRTGSVLIHWGTGSGCYGVTYGFPTLPSGWNDNIRSAEGSSNCWASHYQNASYGGQVLTCAPYCSTLSFLNAMSSSIVYRPVGTFG